MCSRSLALYLDRPVIYASSKVLCGKNGLAVIVLFVSDLLEPGSALPKAAIHCSDLGRGPQQFFPTTREGLQRQENLRERTCFSLPRRTSDRRDRPVTDYC